MGYQQYFGGAIWTNHALERLRQRRLPQDTAWKAFQYPEKSIPGKQDGTVEYQRWFGKSLVTVIAKQNERKEWIILSCWVDPPIIGSFDHPNTSFWGKLWLELRRQIGI